MCDGNNPNCRGICNICDEYERREFVQEMIDKRRAEEAKLSCPEPNYRDEYYRLINENQELRAKMELMKDAIVKLAIQLGR